jgi:hypothetical protein
VLIFHILLFFQTAARHHNYLSILQSWTAGLAYFPNSDPLSAIFRHPPALIDLAKRVHDGSAQQLILSAMSRKIAGGCSVCGYAPNIAAKGRPIWSRSVLAAYPAWCNLRETRPECARYSRPEKATGVPPPEGRGFHCERNPQIRPRKVNAKISKRLIIHKDFVNA